jgi:hypothetical protein
MISKTDEIREEAKEQVKDSAMSESGKKAMQFMTERNRLRQELQEMESLVEELSPVTSTGKSDEYVKWIATVLAISGVFMISAEMGTIGQICYMLSSVCWVYVGASWNDKAIMIGSAITGTSVAMNLTKYLFA